MPPYILAQDAGSGLWTLFVQSFDLFSVVLISGSVIAVALMVRNAMDIRPRRILPGPTVETMRRLIATGRIAELREFTRKDRSFPSRVVHAALRHVPAAPPKGSSAPPQKPDPTAAREAAELAASEESASWFRRVEPLNVIGNLGPLVGLAGTIWGMILAFSTLGMSAGQATPAELSLGISKALFHTLLGLCLAAPCLLVFGLYRGIIDRVCTRAMVVSSELVESVLAHGSGPLYPTGHAHAAPPAAVVEARR
ncbi:MAG: MotA/TolQ/ExbB proton channel family protein [Phycisphaerales bacterium]|nr:MotA/TolQ/ExbB proton channel family protein [Phycisphaerales bacterium]